MKDMKFIRCSSKICMILWCMIFLMMMNACGGKEEKKDWSIFGTNENSESEIDNPITNQDETLGKEGSNLSIIEMSDTLIDIGDVKKGKDSKRTAHFKFYNKGKSDLVVNNVEPYCSCTKATFTKEPISPGKHGKIDVTFDADLVVGRHFTKELQVFSNAQNGTQLIKIKGTISY